MKTAAYVLTASAFLLMTLSTAALAFQGGVKPHEPGVAGMEQPSANAISGKVIETMDSGGYTYVHLEEGGQKIWVAVPRMKVKVGETHAFLPGDVMNNFESKTMKRKFDKIVFSPGPMVLPGTKAEAKAKQAEGEVAAKVDKVKKSGAKGAQTVADCYSKSAKLDKKKVAVRGKVVKVSKMIMGKNWVHLQDGTGEPGNGTHNLVVTTMDVPEVGDVVTATGTLAKDRDFGYGYKYDVIVEDAAIKK